MAIYFTRLAEQAQKYIGSRYQSKFDGDDIAVTVLNTIAKRIRNGKVEIDDEKRFWALLMAVMRFKVYRQIEYWNALVRDVRREQRSDATGSEDSLPDLVIQLMSKEPTPDEGGAFADLIDNLLVKLDEATKDRFKDPPSCKEVLLARLAGKEYVEICEEVRQRYGKDISTKTIANRMQVTKEVLRDFPEKIIA